MIETNKKKKTNKTPVTKHTYFKIKILKCRLGVELGTLTGKKQHGYCTTCNL